MNISPSHHEISQANETLVRRYFDMWSTGDGAAADRLLGPTYLDHTHPDVLGPAAVRSLVPRFRAASPDARIEIEILGECADKVAVKMAISRSSSRQPVERGGVAVFRVDGGKLAEQWSWYDGEGSGVRPSACDAWEEARRRAHDRGVRGLADMFAIDRG